MHCYWIGTSLGDLRKIDQYHYLGNCAPTPPLTQHVIIS